MENDDVAKNLMPLKSYIIFFLKTFTNITISDHFVHHHCFEKMIVYVINK